MISVSRLLLVFLSLLVHAVGVAGQVDDGLRLEPGKAVERELRGGEKNSYRLRLDAGQLLHIVATQKGIDVVVAVFGPDGEKIAEVDSPNGRSGIEPLWLITKAAGDYRLDVASLEKSAPAGSYEVAIVELRPALPKDDLVVSGFQMMSEGSLLAAQDSDDAQEQGIEKLKAASELFRQAGVPKQQAQVLANIAEIYQFQSRSELSIDFNLQAFRLFESEASKREAGVVLARIGEVYNYLSDYLTASDYFRRAIIYSESVGDKRTIASINNNWAMAEESLGNFDTALAKYQKSLDIAAELNIRSGIAATLNNIGNLYEIQGDFSKALEFQMRQLSLIESNGMANLVPRTLLNIGNIHYAQGNHLPALDYYEKALQGFEKSREARGISYALNNIGNIYLGQDDYEKALEYFEKSLQVKGARVDADALNNLGLVYSGKKQYDKALEYFTRALEISRGLNPYSLLFAANTYAFKGDYEKSLELSGRAIELSRQNNIRPILSQAYTSAAKANLKLGRIEAAERNAELAIETNEELRILAAGGAQEAATFFEQFLQPYYLRISLSFSRKNFEEAFLDAERSKSRSLLDILRNGKGDFSKSMSEQERERERRLRNELISLNARISTESEQGDEAEIGALRSELARKRREFENFRTGLYAANPEVRVRRGDSNPISLEKAAELLPDDKTVLLEYAVSKDTTFLFTISKDAAQSVSLKVFALDVSVSDLAERTESFRSKLATGDAGFSKDAKALYDLLLRPAERELAGKTKLVIVPDAGLWNLPFQALQTSQSRYLVEQASISYAPSLTALNEMSPKGRSGPRKETTLLAFGNPSVGEGTSDRVRRVFLDEALGPLLEAERLVKTLGELYGPKRSKIFTGMGAREQVAKSESSKFRIVQFAAHGVLNNASPMYSHILLSQDQDDPNEDGLLEAWEMKDLDLEADLVILSACETARGRLGYGEGVIGMTWALFIAGAPTTVASQWKVESSSTAELMLEFHRQLLAGRVSKAEALRRASLKVMKMPRYRHPKYWAAWVMVGDGS